MGQWQWQWQWQSAAQAIAIAKSVGAWSTSNQTDGQTMSRGELRQRSTVLLVRHPPPHHRPYAQQHSTRELSGLPWNRRRACPSTYLGLSTPQSRE